MLLVALNYKTNALAIVEITIITVSLVVNNIYVDNAVTTVVNTVTTVDDTVTTVVYVVTVVINAATTVVNAVTFCQHCYCSS